MVAYFNQTHYISNFIITFRRFFILYTKIYKVLTKQTDNIKKTINKFYSLCNQLIIMFCLFKTEFIPANSTNHTTKEINENDQYEVIAYTRIVDVNSNYLNSQVVRITNKQTTSSVLSKFFLPQHDASFARMKFL